MNAQAVFVVSLRGRRRANEGLLKNIGELSTERRFQFEGQCSEVDCAENDSQSLAKWCRKDARRKSSNEDPGNSLKLGAWTRKLLSGSKQPTSVCPANAGRGGLSQQLAHFG